MRAKLSLGAGVRRDPVDTRRVMKNQRFLLLGSAAVILTFGGAQAAIAAMSPLQPASSYDELLEPVSNAGLALLGDDLTMAQQKPEGRIAEY